ncbi:Xylanolytic transcriptional activator xlnR [Lecanosticta acicola]|uniref:Xylanolytic transcriptional activator xlnR n=1 Tax=Lecanosticta acicola TaxID=111012 RepID=A0AAI8Z0U9_9PEZI|nr:Xylanolytic transcriptional activator xlnR [Lecanosticta acicola]
MLSSAVLHQQYSSPFGSTSNGDMATHSPMPQQPMSTNGLDALAEGSQYAMQQLQQQQAQQTQNGARPGAKQIQRQSYCNTDGEEGEEVEQKDAKGGKNGQPVRRRISRACDQCNQLRTKCDGKHPCAHCVEFGLTCEYARERKKRGKASRKDIAAAQAAAAAATDDTSPKSGNENSSEEPVAAGRAEGMKGVKRRRSSGDFHTPQLPPPRANSMNSQPPRGHAHMPSGGSVTSNPLAEPNGVHARSVPVDHQTPGVGLPTPRIPTAPMQERGISVGMSEYGSIDDYHRSILHPGGPVAGHNILHSGPSSMPHSMMQGGTITGYGDSPYGVPSPSSQQGMPGHPYPMRESPLSGGFLGQSPVGNSPGWLSLPSPSAALNPHLQHPPSKQTLRYPVLRPLLPHVSAIIPIGLACDLLELYFSSTSSIFMQPQSPYVLGYFFRKRSFLRQTSPRVCSPALLASMLWVAAQTSGSAFFTSAPSARGKICQKLLELTVGLLKPLIHTPNDSSQMYRNTVINGVALGGFGVALPGHTHEMEGGTPGASGALDDVATYIHLATVVSASEYKAASLRWWHAAWSLARELKLGREQPPIPGAQNPDGPEAEAEATGEANHAGMSNQPGFFSEEEREERRRIWWLLFIVDRHLALCYNRPLALLDVECDGLLQPDNDNVWQAGEFYPGENHAGSTYFRRRGPGFECTGHGIFGYFLPLMTMLGEIVDLNHAKNHPRFGMRFKSSSDWDDQASEISKQLEAYGRSLREFDSRHGQASEPKQQESIGMEPSGDATSPHSVGTNHSNQQRIREEQLQTKIVVAYCTHLMHTLHILLNGKWDPISLLDDNDLWISSQSFVSATGHAVSAAEAINEILEFDPDLSFMPFFFGIYLLQGSFLLLLIADKLQAEASPSVVKACETIVRAHEACVVTLNTEYQRNFRKVMRSALAQVRGRLQEDFGEQQLRRREVLSLYRWTGDGTGLAL